MADNNEVTSPPAQTAAPAVAEPNGDGRRVTSPPAQANGDEKRKGGMTDAAMQRYFMQRMKEVATAPATDTGKGDATAAPAEKTAVPEEIAKPPATSEAKTETPSEPKAEPTKDAPEVLSNFSNLDPKTRKIVESALSEYKEKNQHNVQERINAEIAKRKSLEEELGRVRQAIPQKSPLDQPQAQTQQAAPLYAPVPTEQPLSHINDLATLDNEFKLAKQLRREADDLLTAGPDASGKYQIAGKELSKDQVIAIRRNTAVVLEEQIPQRMQFLQARQQNKTQAETDFPWLSDQASPEFQKAAAIASAYPFLRNFPNAENILGVLVEGVNALEARKAAKAKGPDKTVRSTAKPPASQTAFTGVSSAASRQTDDVLSKRGLANEREKLKEAKGVSGRDMARYFLASEQLRNSRSNG